MSKLLKKLLAIFSTIFALGSTTSLAGASAPSAEKLMVVMRELAGANIETESFEQLKVKAKSEDGKTNVELNMAWYEYIGDMHIRFVFDDKKTMRNATMQDLKVLNLSLDEALKLALKKIKATYGNPDTKPWAEGIIQVKGKSKDLDSSYFLDRDFWNQLLKKHPEGLVAAVPSRGGLLYTPLSDTNAVDTLKLNINDLYQSSSEQLRVSSKLYLFKNGKWSIFQYAK